jgi:branched-chain amino acid transport system substrate-binding protein
LSRAWLTLVAVALGGLLAGCGAKAGTEDQIPGRTLTIYASIPLHGASRVEGAAVISGASLALASAQERVGRYRIVFRPLDDSTLARGEWDPGQTSENARLAVQDRTAVAYIGELNSGASAVSIPLLNRLGIAQLSPSSTAVGLTTAGPGAAPGEPEKYYPTGVRTFARIIPSDAVQAHAQVRLQRSLGCTKTFVLEDGEVDGEDASTSFSLAAQAGGLPVAAVQAFDTKATDYSSLAAAIAQTGSNCVLISAITDNNAVTLTKQLAAKLPTIKIFGTAGLAESTYVDPALGGIPTQIDPRVWITVATLDPSAYPPAARRFITTYEHSYGPPQPYAIYGYEAMSLVLNAIARGSDNGTRPVRRSAVRKAIFDTRDRTSVLGTYGITPDGDTTSGRYGVYRVVDGRLSFWKAIQS